MTTPSGNSFTRYRFVLLILVGLGAIIIGARFKGEHSRISWRHSYATAADEARQSHKRMLVDFYADWCGPCQEMERETWSNASVATAVAGFVPLHVNVDDQPDLAAKYGVSGIPNIAIIDADGRVVKQQEGLMEPEDLRAWLPTR